MYDADQRLRSETQTSPSGASTGYWYSYNDAGNTDWLGNVVNFHYDASGNLTAEDVPGVRVSYGPVSITIAHDKTDLAVLAYARNQVGLIEQARSVGLPGSAGKVADYSYTKRGQLAVAGDLSFGYDSAGNLTSSSTGFSQIFNAGDELTSRDSSFTGPADYSYDPEGDLTSVLTPGGPTTHLAYNQANWLTGITSPRVERRKHSTSPCAPFAGNARTTHFYGPHISTSARNYSADLKAAFGEFAGLFLANRRTTWTAYCNAYEALRSIVGLP